MAKFVYKLQNILNVKMKLEEQAKNEYALAKVRLDQEINRLHVLEQTKVEYESRLKGRMENRLIVADIITLNQAVKTLEYKMLFRHPYRNFLRICNFCL